MSVVNTFYNMSNYICPVNFRDPAEDTIIQLTTSIANSTSQFFFKHSQLQMQFMGFGSAACLLGIIGVRNSNSLKGKISFGAFAALGFAYSVFATYSLFSSRMKHEEYLKMQDLANSRYILSENLRQSCYQTYHCSTHCSTETDRSLMEFRSCKDNVDIAVDTAFPPGTPG